jgi:hypothetical protein
MVTGEFVYGALCSPVREREREREGEREKEREKEQKVQECSKHSSFS